jgi:hypothetical protein
MNSQRTATVSRRWDAPTYNAAGKYYTARLKDRLSPHEERVGVGSAAYGPTERACVAETVRMDRAWVMFPARTGDDAASRERARFLVSGDAA